MKILLLIKKSYTLTLSYIIILLAKKDATINSIT